jgi:uncharacterized protein (DUF58 family)
VERVMVGVNDAPQGGAPQGGAPHLGATAHFVDYEDNTRGVKPWIAVAVLLTLGGLLLQSRLVVAAAVMMGVILLAAWIWFKVSLVGVEYERTFRDAQGLISRHEVRAFLGETVEINLRVRNRKVLPLNWLQVVDVFPLELPLHDVKIALNRTTNQGEFASFWMPGAYQTLERRFTIFCTKRGYSTYGPATVSTGDGFGFFTRKARLPVEQRLIIYPHLYTAGQLGLPAKNPFGERSSDQLLFEDPLRNAGIREWQAGDGMRRVHWKASAKYQRLLSRVYEPSEEPQIQIILNVATLERHWEGVVEDLHERAVSVAGTLALVATEHRLPVGLLANGYLPGSDQNIRLLPGRSRNQLMNILELLAAATPYASQSVEDLLLRKASGLPWGATLAVVTPVTYDGLYDALVELTQWGRKVLLFSLAASPPARPLPGVMVYHLSDLEDDTMRVAEMRV